MTKKRRKTLDDALAQQFVYGEKEAEISQDQSILAVEEAESERPTHDKPPQNPLIDQAGTSSPRLPNHPTTEVSPPTSQQASSKTSTFMNKLQLQPKEATKRFTVDLPESMQLGVIGSATQQALHRVIGDRGISLVAHEPYNSEALLDAAGLQQVEGKRVLIFRGQSGRTPSGCTEPVRPVPDSRQLCE